MKWPSVGQTRIERAITTGGHPVRVPDQYLGCVAFIAEVVAEDSAGMDLNHQATGFFVTMPSTVEGLSYPFFVTAKHSAAALVDRDIVIRVNTRSGGVEYLEAVGKSWYLHPTDASVDVAVIPCLLNRNLDVFPIRADRHFLTKDLMREKKIGVGDEIFTIGLFTPAVGTTRNMPIVRHGNIAMLPSEPIQVEDEFAEVFLVESRSIPGLSGSPAFVCQTLAIDFGDDPSGIQRSLKGNSSQLILLGLVRGHWDIRESDLNKPSFIHDRQRGVNLGIATVVPAEKILEVLNQPSLVKLREASDAEVRKGRSAGDDSVNRR